MLDVPLLRNERRRPDNHSLASRAGYTECFNSRSTEVGVDATRAGRPFSNFPPPRRRRIDKSKSHSLRSVRSKVPVIHEVAGTQHCSGQRDEEIERQADGKPRAVKCTQVARLSIRIRFMCGRMPPAHSVCVRTLHVRNAQTRPVSYALDILPPVANPDDGQ